MVLVGTLIGARAMMKSRKSKPQKRKKKVATAFLRPKMPLFDSGPAPDPGKVQFFEKPKVGSDGSKDSTHYGGADNPHETIKCLEAWGLERDALLWNAVKYISRAGKKVDQSILKDLRKALYYLKRRVEKLEEQVAKVEGQGK